MNSNQITIKINPKDIYKISPELILNITLKNGYIILLDDSIPLQEINKIIYNYKNDYKNDDNLHTNNRNNNIRSINLDINKSYTKDNINGKTLEINDSYIFNQNNNTKNFFYSYNKNNTINQNQIENKNNNFKSQNQSISDLVNEKIQKKFHNSLKNSKNRVVNTTINSEININIKGNKTKNNYSNDLLKDFDELLLNFNDKKKGLNKQNINNNSKKKYKYYKKFGSKKNDKLFLDDLSGISPNTKAIKYIRNEQNNNVTITTEFNRNHLGKNNRLSFLKEKALRRNKSNNFYLLKNDRITADIISPPNNLPYNKIFLMQK